MHFWNVDPQFQPIFLMLYYSGRSEGALDHKQSIEAIWEISFVSIHVWEVVSGRKPAPEHLHGPLRGKAGGRWGKDMKGQDVGGGGVGSQFSRRSVAFVEWRRCGEDHSNQNRTVFKSRERRDRGESKTFGIKPRRDQDKKKVSLIIFKKPLLVVSYFCQPFCAEMEVKMPLS